MEREFRDLWDQLRAKKPQYRVYLDALRIQALRGISDLQVSFPYPVSVIAGTQGCGKSTVLMAAACAYKVPERNIRENVPSTFFPSFSHIDQQMPADQMAGIRLTFNYIEGAERTSMTWSKNKSWNRSFAGRARAEQPNRIVYIRSLSTLANPSEVRSALQMGRLVLKNAEIDPSLISFAQRILPFRYSRLDQIASDRKSLLFAHRRTEDEILYQDTLIPETRPRMTKYSEFHMSGGERSIIRLSIDISQLQNALVLIDEVEIALHPYTQQTLMMELQRLALRNNLQIIVTSHSPAIFDTVPPEARIFLERETFNVRQRMAYPDVLQNAFYGRNFDKLSILCEDKISEAIVRGIFDYLCPKLNLRQSDINIGKDTGKSEYPTHMKTLRMFKEIDSFIFVLDGDAETDERLMEKIRPFNARVVFLPEDAAPEKWLVDTVRVNFAEFAELFALDSDSLRSELRRIEQLYESATTRRSDRHKFIFEDICLLGKVDPAEVARRIARMECESERGRLIETRDRLEDGVAKWRSRNF